MSYDITYMENLKKKVQFSSVQLLSCVRLFPTPWNAARQASLSFTNSQSLLKLMKNGTKEKGTNELVYKTEIMS